MYNIAGADAKSMAIQLKLGSIGLFPKSYLPLHEIVAIDDK